MTGSEFSLLHLQLVEGHLITLKSSRGWLEASCLKARIGGAIDKAHFAFESESSSPSLSPTRVLAYRVTHGIDSALSRDTGQLENE